MSVLPRHRSAVPDLGPDVTGLQPVHLGSRFELWDAVQRDPARPVLVKTASRGAGSWVLDLLRHEATVLAAIGGHPNVLTLHQQLATHDGRTALVLEHGRTLEDDLHAGRSIPHDEATAIGISVAGALETAHHAGWVHRDVRPVNILRSDTGLPALAGFHESVALDGSASAAPLHVTTLHTAPELIEGATPTPASDVYGLASTLYELIAGRAAFRAYAGESPAAVVARVLNTRVRPIIAPDVPLELSDLLTWSMSGDPAQRPPSPAWLAEELGRIARRNDWDRPHIVVA